MALGIHVVGSPRRAWHVRARRFDKGNGKIGGGCACQRHGSSVSGQDTAAVGSDEGLGSRADSRTRGPWRLGHTAHGV